MGHRDHRTRGRERLTLTVEEAAAALGIDRSTAYELAAADLLPAPTFRLGRRLVVGRRALERALAGRGARRVGPEGGGDGAA